MDKKDNPMSRLMELAAPYKGEYVLSVILAILGVAAGLLPFFAVSKIVILLMDGETSVSVYMEWCLIAGIGFLGKVCFANFSTLVSHTATFATLAEIRLKLADKLTRVPMGYMINTPLGELKNVLVEQSVRKHLHFLKWEGFRQTLLKVWHVRAVVSEVLVIIIQTRMKHLLQRTEISS